MYGSACDEPTTRIAVVEQCHHGLAIARGLGRPFACDRNHVAGHRHVNLVGGNARQFQHQHQVVLAHVKVDRGIIPDGNPRIRPRAGKEAIHFVLELTNLAPRIPDAATKTAEQVHDLSS